MIRHWALLTLVHLFEPFPPSCLKWFVENQSRRLFYGPFTSLPEVACLLVRPDMPTEGATKVFGTEEFMASQWKDVDIQIYYTFLNNENKNKNKH